MSCSERTKCSFIDGLCGLLYSQTLSQCSQNTGISCDVTLQRDTNLFYTLSLISLVSVFLMLIFLRFFPPSQHSSQYKQSQFTVTNRLLEPVGPLIHVILSEFQMNRNARGSSADSELSSRQHDESVTTIDTT